MFQIQEAIHVLSSTPDLLRQALSSLPPQWVPRNEGSGSWSPFDVVGHLIHGEKTDWIPRIRMILEFGEERSFEPFNREAMFESSRGKTLDKLLDEFEFLRKENLETLRMLNLSLDDLSRVGLHPSLGRVTLNELLATWVVHDLDHMTQILRTAAKQYGADVGPWKAYLSVLQDRSSETQS